MVQDIIQNTLSAVECPGLSEKMRVIWRYIVRGAEIAASAIPFISVIATIIAQVLYTGYNPWQEPVSSLVWSPNGSLQTAAFYLLGISVLILVIKLLPKAKNWILKAGIAALSFTGVGMIMVGIFPAGQAGFPETVTNAIHLNVTSILICLFPIACFIMAPKIKECFLKRWVSIYTWSTGIAGVAFIVIVAVLHLQNLGWLGTLERLIILNGLIWVQTITIMTLKKSKSR